MTLLLLLACTSKGPILETGDTEETGNPECGRVRGATGVLMYTEDATVVHAPTEPPSDERYTTGIAGPLGDGLTWVASYGGVILQSLDAGCNWEEVGSLPATGWWQLLVAGDRFYAFDRDSSSGARSDDAGLSWTPFDAGGVFVDLPAVSSADPAMLRGVQDRGVVTSFDGGTTWSVTGAAPEGGLLSAMVHPTNTDRVVTGNGSGVWISTNGGGSWVDVSDGLTEDATTPGVRGVSVAVHPDDADVLFALSQDGSGLYVLHRSPDVGAVWTRMTDSLQVHLDDTSPLWPTPGDPGKVASAWGSAADGLDLYVSQVGIGTRTVTIGSYFGMSGLAYGPDRWLASVHAVP